MTVLPSQRPPRHWRTRADPLAGVRDMEGVPVALVLANKIDWGPGLRIYLAKDGLKIIILIGGGTKKRQQQDIDQALALWEDYRRRKASTPKGAK